jgi:hypothetical protein
LIALEPEAASLFCMHLPVDKMSVEGDSGGTTAKVSPFQKGTKYMVVDVGGKKIGHDVYVEKKSYFINKEKLCFGRGSNLWS